LKKQHRQLALAGDVRGADAVEHKWSIVEQEFRRDMAPFYAMTRPWRSPS
jgi:hypothetical protein